MEENKKETIEEVAERFYKNKAAQGIFIYGAKWKAERMYSEDEVLEFTQKMIQQYKFGNTNIEQLYLLKESLEKFKNK
jgi:hypothetical protein